MKNEKMIGLALIVILAIAVLGEGMYIMKKRHDLTSLRAQMMATTTTPTTDSGEKSPPPKPMLLQKGMKLADNPVAQFAFKVAPGPISAEAQAALTGFTITNGPVQKDGSMTVFFVPKDSDDQKQEYTVKKGETLYFVEMTPADDKADQDKDMNYRDDYGVITDANGVVQ